jgi:hypothetical protein
MASTRRQPLTRVADVTDEDPQNWRLEITQDRIDLYSELSVKPRALSPEEASMLVELVDAL